MSRRPDHSFAEDELIGTDDTVPEPSELAAVLAVAGELERVAREPSVRPSPGFVDRVGSAIASEPLPAPVAVARESLRRRSPLGFLGALRDAGRVAFGAGRPTAIRAQALALVLAVLVGAISLGGATALAAGQLLAPGPEPTQVPATASPSTSPTPMPSESPAPTLQPVPTPLASEPDSTDRAGVSATSDSSDSPRPSASLADTPGPNESPTPTMSQDPDESSRPTDHGSPGSGGAGHGPGPG